MRHKQRPNKSSRHKSVTFVIDAHTSFGDSRGSTIKTNIKRAQPILASTTPQEQYQAEALLVKTASKSPNLSYTSPSHNRNYFPSYDYSPVAKSATSFFPPTFVDHHTSKKHYATNTISSGDTNTNESNSKQSISVSSDNHRHNNIYNDTNLPQVKKQFEHNNRHMSNVMRLAFLENNDISIDDCSNLDYNSLSTTSLLQKRIHQQLQQSNGLQLLEKPFELLESQVHHDRNFNEYQKEDANLDDDDYSYSIDDCRIFATEGSNLTSSKFFKDLQRRITLQTQLELNSRNKDDIRQAGTLFGIHQEQDNSTDEPSNDIPVEVIQNHVEGFLCDEPECGKSFPSLRKLRHHKVVHSDEFPFVCEFNGCAKKFKRKFGIDLHSTTHFDLDPDMYSKTSNNSSLPFFGRRMQYSMCKPCGQKFKTVHEYQYHMLKHGKEPFKCPVKGCGQTFSIWKSFQKHRASHYFNYYCKMDQQCDHQTSNLQLLKLHIYCCHFKRKLPENATLSSEDLPKEDMNQDERLDECITEAELGMSFSSPVPNQEITTTKIRINSSVVNISQQLAQDHQGADADSTLSSNDQLDESLSKSPELARRDSRLRKNPPRSCTYQHQEYISPKRIKVKCDLCDLSFSSRSHLTKHLATHLELSQPKQESNEIIFEQQPQEEIQQATGSGEFSEGELESSDETLLVNRGSKRRLEEILPVAFPNDIPEEASQNFGEGFFCDEPDCGKSFPSLRKLRHHKVVHSDDCPFVCEFTGCAKKFKRKFGIDLHSTTHFDLDPDMYSKTSNKDDIPFFGCKFHYSTCRLCGQKFKTVHDYQYHMLKHGEEPFKCHVKSCGQTFDIWKSFQKHRASHYFNYYCKMDPQCDHQTSNLQLLKLHIYCCHFKRKLPENATLCI